MGWADLLVKLRLPYNHPRAFELAEKVMGFIETESRNQSSELAKTRGKFPNWDGSVYKNENISMRNATVTTIAPTGTISIIAGCSSGIEPYYSIVFERNVMDGTRLMDINPLFENTLKELKLDQAEIISQAATSRSIKEIKTLPDEIRAVFLTAADITPEEHIRMQAAFQTYCDSSVSKTINFPQNATRDDVRKAFMLAYSSGCKGVTIYRDNSRPNQVLSSVTADTKDSNRVNPEKRPSVLSGITEKISTGYGNLYITINVKNGRPFEVFAHIGKSGYTTMADTEAICRLISLALRSHIPIDKVIKQLRGIGGSSQIFSGGARIFSIPDAIAQILNKHFPSDVTYSENETAEICPNCSSPMRFESGCFNCAHCGYSNC